jgi:hypothetical protein
MIAILSRRLLAGQRARWRCALRQGLVLGALTLARIPDLHAQERDAERLTVKHDPERVLGEHTFLTPVLFPAAFVGTSFLLRQGFMSVEIQDYPVDENVNVDVDMLGQSERLEASLRFLDRFELFLAAGGQALVGSSVRSAIAGGSSFTYDIGGGGVVRLFRNPHSGTQLALRAQGAYGPGGVLDLLQVVDAVIDLNSENVGSVVSRSDLRKLALRDTERADGSLKLLLAQAFSRTFALQAVLGASYAWSSIDFYHTDTGSKITSTSTSFDPEAGVAFGANLDPAVPLGFTAEYSARAGRRSLPGSEDAERKLSHVVALGAHIVHPHFQVGLNAARIFGVEPIERVDASGVRRSSGTPRLHSVQLSLQFTWQ